MLRTNQVTYVEVIVHVSILTTGLGTIVSATTATMGIHIFITIAKVLIYVFTLNFLKKILNFKLCLLIFLCLLIYIFFREKKTYLSIPNLLLSLANLFSEKGMRWGKVVPTDRGVQPTHQPVKTDPIQPNPPG